MILLLFKNFTLLYKFTDMEINYQAIYALFSVCFLVLLNFDFISFILWVSLGLDWVSEKGRISSVARKGLKLVTLEGESESLGSSSAFRFLSLEIQ